MASPPTPEEIRGASFRSVFRGLDQAEVVTYLDQVAEALEELRNERDRLQVRLGELAERDLKSEFEVVGREVASVLEAARQAAETMRERASADAARWREEATAEAETLRREAGADAEALRTDAWTTGTRLLEQSQAEAARTASAAERDSLSVLGEAEREAHRLVSSARREAEDLVRNARMEAEKLASSARVEYEEVIAAAHRQAEAAQERTRALEERRQELMAELESVRATLASFEAALEDRRAGLGLSEPEEMPRRAVVTDESGQPHVEDWEEGHTVRVIRPSREEAASDTDPLADELADEVSRLRQEAPLIEDQEPAAPPEETPAAPEEPAAIPDEPATGPEELAPGPGDESPADEEAPGLDDEVVSDAAPPAPPDDEVVSDAAPPAPPDDVGDLFRRLRRPSPEEVDVADEGELAAARDAVEPAEVSAKAALSEDPFALRDRLLLPLANTTLRTVKRALMESQNVVLDQIRVKAGEWEPDLAGLGEELADEIEGLLARAVEAGVAAAGELGLEVALEAAAVALPETVDIGAELTASLQEAVGAAGAGPRESAAAASRVFRGWRTDHAERRVRTMAFTGYHRGLAGGLAAAGRGWEWVPRGRLCPRCREASAAGDVLPPIHHDCECTIGPA